MLVALCSEGSRQVISILQSIAFSKESTDPSMWVSMSLVLQVGEGSITAKW